MERIKAGDRYASAHAMEEVEQDLEDRGKAGPAASMEIIQLSRCGLGEW